MCALIPSESAWSHEDQKCKPDHAVFDDVEKKGKVVHEYSSSSVLRHHSDSKEY